MSIWTPFPDLQQELDRVRGVITDEIAAPGGIISESLGDLAQRDAKLLRPGFTILAARIRGKSQPVDDRIIHLAAAVEMLHMASLIHDDIVDNADTRRGRPAVHVTHGSRTAVLLGDFLFARSLTLVAEHARSNNGRALSPSIARLVSAAIAEVNSQGRLDVTPRQYLHRIVGKTAILFALSFHVGAVESDPEKPEDMTVQTLRRIGYNLGVGFQIIDDLLDIAGDPARTGKPRGTDLRAGMVTLPVIIALRKDGYQELAHMIQEVHRGTEQEERLVERIHSNLHQTGALVATAHVAQRYTRRARRELTRLPESQNRDVLSTLAEELLQRSA